MPLSRRALLTVASAASLVAQTLPRRAGGPLRVVLMAPFEPDEQQTLQRTVGSTPLEFRPVRSREELRRELPEAEVVFGSLTGADLDYAPKLKWLQWPGAGIEGMEEGLKKSPLPVANMARTFAPGISETAIGLLLGLTRRIGTDYRSQFLNRQWKPLGTVKSEDHIELAGRTMGIVGFGGIGSGIARRAYYGFDMKIVATDAKPLPKPEYVAELHDPTWFPTMVPMVDVLVSAAPQTRQTEKMFNEAVFRRMKPTSYFIAMSRGGLFDDMALVKALKEKWIAGAGLDVFPVEPIPSTHPIFDCPNVLITPHTSGWGRERQERLVALFGDNLRRYVNGLPLVNVVDKVAGY